jgi:hypothetical protein
MRETLLGQGLRDGSSVRRPRIRLEKIAAGGIGGLIGSNPSTTARAGRLSALLTQPFASSALLSALQS